MSKELHDFDRRDTIILNEHRTLFLMSENGWERWVAKGMHPYLLYHLEMSTLRKITKKLADPDNDYHYHGRD